MEGSEEGPAPLAENEALAPSNLGRRAGGSLPGAEPFSEGAWGDGTLKQGWNLMWSGEEALTPPPAVSTFKPPQMLGMGSMFNSRGRQGVVAVFYPCSRYLKVPGGRGSLEKGRLGSLGPSVAQHSLCF